MYRYHNASRTLCIKCWVSAFHTEFEENVLTLQIPPKEGLVGERRPKDRWRQDELLIFLMYQIWAVKNDSTISLWGAHWSSLWQFTSHTQHAPTTKWGHITIHKIFPPQ
jgi:hypothetical protein